MTKLHALYLTCFTVLSGAMLLGCASSAPSGPNDQGQTPIYNVPIEGPVSTAAERAACTQAGGTIRRDGLAGFERCEIAYPDAGKICTDSADCIGDCRGDINSWSPDNPDAAVTGQCQPTNSPFGCFSRVVNGMSGPALCVD